MDEASESQDQPAVPLQYASRADAADALRTYRMVGTALLLYYCGMIAGTCISVAGYYQMTMGAWSAYLQQGLTALEAAVGLAGAVCMIRQSRAGAVLIVGISALRIGQVCFDFLLAVATMHSARPGMFLLSTGPMTTSMLQSAAIAFLAYLFGNHCHKHGAWG